MALPKIETPIYDIELPLSKHKLRFRPFLVKEQKILMMALESQERSNIERNIRQILQNCTLDDVDVRTLPIVDVEYFFLQLRARSIGEVVESRYKCENEVEGKKCGHMMDVEIPLLDIKVDTVNLPETIQLTNTIGVKLKYPEYAVLERLENVESASAIAFELIAECIEYIFEGDQIYYADESTPEEMLEFLESLRQEQFRKIEDYFENLPTIKKTIQVTCAKCGFHHSITLQGLENFFE
jgi:hypothetical protein